jgi:hypothetical protein
LKNRHRCPRGKCGGMVLADSSAFVCASCGWRLEYREPTTRDLWFQDCVDAQRAGVDASREIIQSARPLGNPLIERFADGPSKTWIANLKSKSRDDKRAQGQVYLAIMDEDLKKARRLEATLRRRKKRRAKGSKRKTA